jgi:hypothetical protein
MGDIFRTSIQSLLANAGNWILNDNRYGIEETASRNKHGEFTGTPTCSAWLALLSVHLHWLLRYDPRNSVHSDTDSQHFVSETELTYVFILAFPPYQVWWTITCHWNLVLKSARTAGGCGRLYVRKSLERMRRTVKQDALNSMDLFQRHKNYTLFL